MSATEDSRWHGSTQRAPVGVQEVPRPGVIELAFGVPDPALLPVAEFAQAADGALRELGGQALTYGVGEGPPQLREQLRRRIAETEGRPPGPDELAVTGGVSEAFGRLLTTLTRPGDTVLVELPTYSLALSMLRDHPVRVVGVPIDEDGVDVAGVERACDEAERAGSTVRLLYTIATFHNPTGISLGSARRRELVELAAARGVLVVEDDVYRDLAYDGPAPPSLWSLAPSAVARLGSFSKSLAPGLRVGWLTAPAAVVERYVQSGVVDSGGCVSQFAAVVTARFVERGGYEPHVAMLRAEYRHRRDALAGALRQHLPPRCGFALPAGGYFIWVGLPPGLRATALLAVADAHGVSFQPAARSHIDGSDGGLRVAFSLYRPDDLVEGARRLGAAVREALSA
jgi:DNA-binding transcriptional MocR family regulator